MVSPSMTLWRRVVAATGADTSLIFVPARFNAADSVMEAAAAGVELIVCISEHIPVLDMVKAKAFLKGKSTRLIGPNCPGLITPGECKIGVMPEFAYTSGNVGIVSPKWNINL